MDEKYLYRNIRLVGSLVIGINNNNYMNRFGDDTFLSSMKKKSEEALKQEQIINIDDETKINQNEMIDKIKEEEIARKIASGKSVSLKELKYIQKNNSELLQKAKKANVLSKNIKKEMMSADTEDEVVQIVNKATVNSLMSITSERNFEGGNIEFSLQSEAIEAINKVRGKSVLKSIDKLIY